MANKSSEQARNRPRLTLGESGETASEQARLLNEYSSLRAELLARIEKQQEVTSFALATLAGLVALTQFAERSNSLTDTMLRVAEILPLVSIILSSFTLVTLEHEINIIHIYRYLDGSWEQAYATFGQGADALTKPLSSLDSVTWNRARAAWQQNDGWKSILVSTLSIAKYIATVVPNLGLLVFLAIHLDWRINWPTAFVGVALVLLLAVLGTGLFAAWAYISMGRERGVSATAISASQLNP